MKEDPELTERETQIRNLMLSGLVHKEIAAKLHVSEGTVQAAASSLYRKYGVNTRGQLVAKLARMNDF